MPTNTFLSLEKKLQLFKAFNKCSTSEPVPNGYGWHQSVLCWQGHNFCLIFSWHWRWTAVLFTSLLQHRASKHLCYWLEPIHYRSSNNYIHLIDRMLQNWPSMLPAVFHLTPNGLMWGFGETELRWEMAFKAILYLSDSLWLSETPDILLYFYYDL